MAFDTKSLTVDFTSLSKVPTQARQNAYAQGLIPEQFLSQLTPTQLAKLFPKYYKEGLPDVSGFRGVKPESETFDERARRVGGGVEPTATEAPAGVSAPAPVSRPAGTSQPTVASQNQQAQQAEQAQQGLAGILAPYMPQQAASATSGPAKRYSDTFTPREQAVLSFISKREGSKDPNIVFGGNRYKARLGLDKVPLTERTISDVINNVMPNLRRLSKADGYGKTNSGRIVGTSAVGTGQMIEGTLKANLKHLGIPERDWDKIKFTEELQQRLTLANFETSGIGDPNADPSTWNKRQLANQYESLNPSRGKAPMSAREMANIRAASPERVATPTAQEFQAATAQPTRKNVFKLNKEKLGMFAGLAESKIKEMLPEGVEYNSETGEISGDITMEQIVEAVKKEAPSYADKISEYIQPVGQSLISAAQDEQAAQAQAVPTVAMSDEVKTFISELPEQAREELSKDPAKANAVSAAIKAGEGDRIKNEITQLYSQKDKPTATEVTEVISSTVDDSKRIRPVPTSQKELLSWWSDRSPRTDIKKLEKVDPVILKSYAEAIQQYEANNPGKRVEAFGPSAGVRYSGSTSNHGIGPKGFGRALDVVIIDEKTGKQLINLGTKGYSGQTGSAGEAAAEYTELHGFARVAQEHFFPNSPNLRQGGGFATGSTAGDWMHGDITGRGMGGYSWEKGYTAAQRRKFGISEEQNFRLGDEKSIRELGSQIYGQVDEQGYYVNRGQTVTDTATGGKTISYAKYQPQVTAQVQQQLPESVTQTQAPPDTSGNIIAGAGHTPTPEQAAAQAQATAEEVAKENDKSLWQKAKDWWSGDNSSEAPLAYGADMIARPGNELRITDDMGKEHVVGEAGAEKVTVESKHDPQKQNQVLESSMTSQNATNKDLQQQEPYVDFSTTSLGDFNFPKSYQDAISYSRFGSFSQHLYSNGSKNQSRA